jgi:hypothetical protein
MEQIVRVKRVKRSESAWRELVARHATSDLSVPQFCRGEGINAGVYRRWRAVLSDGGKITARKVRAQPDAAPFIDLSGIGSGSSRFEVRLELGAGVVLSVARG